METKIKPFDGILKKQSTALPSNPARMINGQLRKPVSGVDHLLFGKASCVAPTINLYSRKPE